MQFYFYADEESIQLLASIKPKALLIGGDFGYGNFGDLLQHMGAAVRIKQESGLAVASVLAIDALSRHSDVSVLRKGYGVDALCFVSDRPLLDEVIARLKLRQVVVLRNLALVQLYGGGFLNEMWGDSVLTVAEHLLASLPGVPYVISGQQISPAYAQRMREHIDRYSPRLVGVRDHDSLELMGGYGINAEFSFDDAVEPLLALRKKLELRVGDGAFIHLNTSGYTGNDEALSEMLVHLQGMAARLGGQGRLVLLQAFQDAREDVVDTIETVKRLEAGFPFVDVETALLVRAILSRDTDEPCVLQGRFGYSSSYHVTLWLQLNGIPCWLRGSNNYYAQKRRALGIEGRFEDFLGRMHCPDHGENLHARAQWLLMLQRVLNSTQSVGNRVEWALPDSNAPRRAFHFKGEPRFRQQLQMAWAEQERLNLALGEAHAVQGQADVKIQSGQASLDAARVELQSTRESLTDANARLDACIRELEEAQGRLHACAEQITAIGSEARHYREAYQHEHACLQDVASREREVSARLQEILRSRSWRWTLPLRAGSRFLRTGRVDSAGEIGLFAIAQAIGRGLPIPAGWRSAIGLRLQRLRRR